MIVVVLYSYVNNLVINVNVKVILKNIINFWKNIVILLFGMIICIIFVN